jgi:hypothetical protein
MRSPWSHPRNVARALRGWVLAGLLALAAAGLVAIALSRFRHE